jgi:hypothetical protein
VALLSFIAAAGLAFFLVGDISESFERDTPDSMVRPWRALTENDSAVGLVAGLILLGVAVGVILTFRAHRLTAGQLVWLGAGALLGAWAGLAYRVMTAEVVGANIGGGMVLIATPVIFAVIVGLSSVMARRIDR